MSETIKEPIENYGLNQRSKSKPLFSQIGIVGCGKDGSLIATQVAMCGMDVVFLEVSQEKINNSFSLIEDIFDKKIQGWGLTQSEKKVQMGRIKSTTEYKDLADCDFVIEAVRYDKKIAVKGIEERKNIFKQLEAVLSEKAIIATNVTTIVVSDLVAELEHRDRCIGLHFLSNVPESNILEIVRGIDTSDETFEIARQFTKLINYQSVQVMESSGVVSMRLFLTQLNEACSILMEGISTVEDIDEIMKVGFGYRQGLFQTADHLGIDKSVKLMENMFREFGNVKYKASPVLVRMARAGKNGIHSGEGFYKYDEQGSIINNKNK